MKKNFLLNKTTILAASAVALLGLSAVGSTRAAINAKSEIIKTDFRTSKVEVSLYENGERITDGILLNNNEEFKDFHIGETYDEAISFTNEGDYDAYARVVITKSWYDADGKKNQNLNPTLIDLTLKDSNAWVEETEEDSEDKDTMVKERTVYYYKEPIAAGASVDITSSLTVNNVITEIVTKSEVNVPPKGTIQTTYNYDGKSFSIDVQVDEIQTHNAYDAARASWGVYLDIDENGNIQHVYGTEVQANEN